MKISTKSALLFAPLIFALGLLGCATVRDHREISHPEGQIHTASVGSTLFRLNKIGDLPNAFGGRDIYGGKVDEGFAEVKLAGIEGSKVLLNAFDISRNSTETTMDRYGVNSNVEVSQSINVGNSGNETGIQVVIDTAIEKVYVLAGVKVTFIEIRASSVDYRIEDMLD